VTARDTVLDQIRRSLKSAHLPHALEAIPPRPAAGPAIDPAQLADTFAGEASGVGASVHRPSSHSDAVETVLQLLHDGAGHELLAWADAELPLAGIGHSIRQAGFSLLDPSVPAEPEARAARLAELGRAAGGVTGVLAGLADTGTLVVLSGPGRPRLASLLPPVHIALLPVSALFPTMAAFFARHGAAARDHSNLVFITGPSRSADIEHTLTIGVHGPKSLHIVLLP
jgi:L-lactate dehydrogenase complex protein LldG